MWRGKKRESKAKTQRRHAIKRALQRYNAWLSDDDFEQITRRIRLQTHGVKHLGDQSRRVSVWKVPYREWCFILVFDDHRNQPITFLPPDAKPPFDDY